MKIYCVVNPITKKRAYGVRYTDNTGKDIRRRVADTRKQAEQIAAQIQVELREGMYFDRRSIGNTTLGDLITQYKEDFKVKDSYRTECGHLAAIQNYFTKDRVISTITLEEVEGFRRARIAAPSRRGGTDDPTKRRSLSTVNRELECLRRLLNKAIDWKLLRDNPVDASLLFEEPKGKISYLTVEQAGALLDAAEAEGRSKRRCKRNIHLATIILVALETGMRLGNVLGLRWADVDFAKRYIHLEDTKPGTSLNVAMSARLADALAKVPRRLGSKYVFANQKGEAYKRIEKSFDRAKERAGIPASFTFHDLRHTFITHALDRGVPILVVARIVGHATTYMTERYAHLIEGREHEAVNALPEWRAPSKEVVAAG